MNNIQIIVDDKTAHTPELGPPSVHTEQVEPVIYLDLGSENPLAGFVSSQGLFLDRQKTVSRYANMGKAGMIPGSPDNSMSPGLVNGRREEFGSIGRMMEHWEEMEKRGGGGRQAK